MGDFSAFMTSIGSTSPLLYVLSTALINILPIPGPSGILCTIGGSVFGTIYGALIFSVAATLGATFALIVVRYFMREPLKRWVLGGGGGQGRSGLLKSLDVAVEDEAFQIVFLLRMSPVMPFGLASMLLALTAVPAWSFIVGSFLGVLPASIPFAYAGAITKTYSSGVSENGGKLKAVMTVLGLVATVLVSWRVAVIAQRVLESSALGSLDSTEGESEAILQGAGAGDKGGIGLATKGALQQQPQPKKRPLPTSASALR